ncbi:MAG: hypothetical protein R3E95_19790 [Thiolinea sp.]
MLRAKLVLNDVDLTTPEQKAAVKRLIICSGKVYYDLLLARTQAQRPGCCPDPSGAALSVPWQ